MQGNDRRYAQRMLEAAREAREFMQNRNLNELKNDNLLLLALTRVLEIIGESAARVSDATRREFAQIPWVPLVGMREKLLQASLAINPYMVWTTVTEDLPTLIQSLEKILPPPDDSAKI
jgi:uncharacterized protein with HEPN domain